MYRNKNLKIATIVFGSILLVIHLIQMIELFIINKIDDVSINVFLFFEACYLTPTIISFIVFCTEKPSKPSNGCAKCIFHYLFLIGIILVLMAVGSRP